MCATCASKKVATCECCDLKLCERCTTADAKTCDGCAIRVCSHKGPHTGGGGRGLHSSTFQLNLSRFGHCQAETTERLPQKVLPLSRKVDECKPLGGGYEGARKGGYIAFSRRRPGLAACKRGCDKELCNGGVISILYRCSPAHVIHHVVFSY